MKINIIDSMRDIEWALGYFLEEALPSILESLGRKETFCPIQIDPAEYTEVLEYMLTLNDSRHRQELKALLDIQYIYMKCNSLIPEYLIEDEYFISKLYSLNSYPTEIESDLRLILDHIGVTV